MKASDWPKGEGDKRVEGGIVEVKGWGWLVLSF